MASALRHRSHRVAVIGAGVVGAATAYALASRGAEVTILDGAPGPAEGTSHANGGQLSYLYADALASPKIWAQLPELMSESQPAFRLRATPDLDTARWLLDFLRNCTPGRFDHNTTEVLALGALSRAAMASLLSNHMLDFGYAERGKMQLYRTEAALDESAKTIALKQRFGPIRRLSFDEAVTVEPAIAEAAPEPFGVLYSPEEAMGDARLFTTRLIELLQDHYGVFTQYGVTIDRIEERGADVVLHRGGAPENGADSAVFDEVIVCAGVDSARLLKPFGTYLPILPMKGYSLTAPATNRSPKISLTDVTRRLVFTPLPGGVRVAGMADLGARTRDLDPARLETLKNEARAALPDGLDHDQAGAFWAGLRPMTPNQVPRVGKATQRVAYNTGHGMLGWTLAMGTGERVAELVMPRETQAQPV